MIRIEGHWERIDTLRDVSRVIREYYNHELADVLDELTDNFIEEYDRREIMRDRLQELEDVIEEIQSLVRYV